MPSAQTKPRSVALLRGINVGGNNKLAMRDLAAMFEAVGASDVSTYIQSGNVVFRAAPSVSKKLPDVIAARIEKDFGLRVPVIVRSAVELEQIARDNPFLARGEATDSLHVMFLADTPSKSAASQLDAKRSPDDEFVVVGKDIYLHLPNGVARSKLTNAYFDSKLATVSTGRNWRTVLKLLEMASG